MNPNPNNELEELMKLMNEMDISTFDMVDQLTILLAMAEFGAKVKPIYAKYAAKDTGVTNFLFKL